MQMLTTKQIARNVFLHGAGCLNCRRPALCYPPGQAAQQVVQLLFRQLCSFAAALHGLQQRIEGLRNGRQGESGQAVAHAHIANSRRAAPAQLSSPLN